MGQQRNSTSSLDKSLPDTNFQPCLLEPLESRLLLSAILVSNLNDAPVSAAGDAPGTLRQAIFDANALPGTDQILFHESLIGTILLTEGELDITESVSITGPGALHLTVQAFDPTPEDDNGDGSRIFRIDDGTGTVQDVSISGLTLTGGDVSTGGGAIFSLEDLTVVASHITGNSVSSTSGFLTAGGGIYINNADLIVESSTISNNTAYHDNGAIGGGISSGSGDVTITSSTITGNVARSTFGLSGGIGYGGGVVAGNGTHSFTHSTISNNRASGMDSFGGNIYLFGTNAPATIDHTIVANGLGEFGRDISSGSLVNVSHSLIEFTIGFTLTDGGGNHLNIDPLLGNELLDYGGTVPTLGVRAGSPVIDAGDVSAQGGVGNVPAIDQRGAPFNRVDGVIDIGAIETQTVAGLGLVVDTAVDESDGDYSPGDLSLREAIGLSNGSVGPDTITIDGQLGGQVLRLSLGQLRAVDDLTIDASAGGLTIDASGNDATPNIKQGDGSRIFEFDSDGGGLAKNIELIGLHLTGGDVTGDGGAIRSDENLTLIDMTIDDNFALGFGGGVDADAELELITTTISRNTAAGGTGGINLVPAGFSTTGGGGIRFDGTDLDIDSSTISGNRTLGDDSDGGGIAVFSANLTIRHSTISGNTTSGTGSQGGNISFQYASASEYFTLDHTIVANGSSPSNNDIQSPGDPVLASNSLIEDATGLTINGLGNITGTDPMLGPLADNGGRTQTHALLPGSLAIDGGSFTFTGPPNNDQRGNPFARIVDGNTDTFTIIDIGSYERQTVPGLNLLVDTPSDESDGDYSVGDLSLREAIGLANGSIGNNVITFAPAMLGKTITLTNGELQIVDDLVIDATSLGGHLTIDALGNDPTPTQPAAGDGSRVLQIDDGDAANYIDVELIALSLTGGDVLGNGGAIRNSEHLTIEGSALFGNAAVTLIPNGTGAVGSGGAIQVRGGGSVALDNTSVYNNSAGDVGGGIAVSEGLLTLTNSTISGNEATVDGGGLWASGTGATIVANHSTIAANDADRGGGVYMKAAGAGLTLDHTIVADNTAGTSFDDVFSVDSIVFDHGWVESGAGFTPTGGLQFIGIDPGLTPLGDHGGPTPTHALLATSLAIDAGNLFFTPPPAADQRGLPFDRVVDGDTDTVPRIDIGAYEWQTLPGLNLVVDVATDIVNGNFGAGDLSLREAVSLANGSIGPDSISFASFLSGGLITLMQGQITITEGLTIDAKPLADNVTIDASGSDPTPSMVNGDGSRVLSIDNLYAGNAITVQLGGLELTGGDAGGDGGAIYNSEDLLVDESTVRDSAAVGSNGGGIMVFGGSLTITGSTISGNTSGFGGGIAIRSGVLSMLNTTISGNIATERGGGINAISGGSLEIDHSTISGNLASPSDSGGGIYSGTTVGLSIDHTIVANNSADIGPDISAVETVMLTNSLIENASGFNSIGSPNITGQDPMLGPLADNGGPTLTHALLPGSAAIDAGQFGISGPPDYDQRGAPFDRIVATLGAFDVIDIGAFEVQPIPISGDLNSDGFVGIADLNIVLGNWNQNVTPGDSLQGDPSGDGFVGIADLNTVLGNWNAGTPPTVMTTLSLTNESDAAVSNSQPESIESAESVLTQRQQRRSFQGTRIVTNDDNHRYDASIIAWTYQIWRNDRAAVLGYAPWSLRQQGEPVGLGLWEEKINTI